MDKRESADRWHEIIERWPRYEDGIPVWFGDKLPDFDSTIYKTVKSIIIKENGRVVIDNGGGSANVNVILESGERVNRHLLASDGEPLLVGQTVYSLKDDRPYTVKDIVGNHVYVNAGGAAFDVWHFPLQSHPPLPRARR